MSPTQRQLDALRFIRGYQLAKGHAPTYDEIGAGIGTPFKGAAHRLVDALEERALVARPPTYQQRHLGKPFEVLTDIAVPRDPDGEPLFFVRVRLP